jgi:ATP-binding cassette subfamily B protein
LLVERSATTGGYLLHLLIFGLGAYWVYADRLTLGTFVAFEGMFLSMGESLTYVTQFVPTLAQAAGSARHINEIFAEKPCVIDSIDAVIAPRFAHEITFQSVSFEYAEGPFRLENLQMRIPRGSHVALVGVSGSGKSTILNLLLRFHDPTSGAILIDGRDLRSVTQASLRAQIGIVFQDSVLFHTSIFENIRLGNLGASRQEVESAAQAAEIHDFVVSLPGGYETMVGERGSQLSGGQRQRIAIARALVRDPCILILDEATSALDYATEASILATLRTVTRGRTVIQVTHRLASVIDADQIVILEHGKVVEEGAHQALIERGGVYANLLTF